MLPWHAFLCLCIFICRHCNTSLGVRIDPWTAGFACRQRLFVVIVIWLIYFNNYFYTYILLHINITTKCPNTMTQYYWIKDNALFITRAPDEPECNHLIQFSQLHFLAHVCVRPANPPVGGTAANITANTELPGDSDPGADVDRLVSAGHPEGSNEKLICKS